MGFVLNIEIHYSEKYGDWVVDVETSKKENIMKLSKTMKLNKFINLYRNKNIYVLTDVMQEQNISGDII